MNAVEVRSVTKVYRGGARALDDVSLSIGGGVYGLLGHNGAGKTTLMKSIVTISKPTRGSIAVCGKDTVADGPSVRSQLGYLPQDLAMHPNMTVLDFLSYIAAVKGVHGRDAVAGVLAQVGLEDVSRRKIRQLSGGMRRRVGIAQALIGEPRVLVVDEPTAGLDPEERVRFRGILSRYAKSGRAVILSTHIVEDVYQLCHSLAVLRQGRVFYQGSAEGMMGTVTGKVKIVQVRSEGDLVRLQARVPVVSTRYENGSIFARVVDSGGFFPRLEPCAATLEDAYVYCMGGKADA